ncbi:hypothetical protein [Pararhizobium sp. PWRC1-1]|uniref:hypothetical protein n=1 Tax=Pararhizobium sp. PWRC1-1 TaxID=2804566 RepID=UPI003CF10CCC
MNANILIAALTLFSCGEALAETIKLDDGATCTIIESGSSSDRENNTTVTAGGGKVSSSTTIGGKTTTTNSATGSSTSSASASSGDGTTQSFSTSSITRPDGSIVTRNSDGTCYVEKPSK